MAMTKAEKAEVAALQTQLALRWPVDADPTPVSVGDTNTAERELRVLWHFNAYSKTVEQGCTDGFRHALGRTDKPDRRDAGGPWYSTQREAWIAMRWSVCRKFAAELALIDLKLEQPPLVHISRVS